MPKSHSSTELEQDLCVHVFTVSAAIVGVCLTVIGLVRIVVAFRKVDTLADDLIAVNALALRTRNARRMHRVERVADGVFVLTMVLMVCICGFITFAIANV